MGRSETAEGGYDETASQQSDVFAEARRRMVVEQLTGRGRDITEPEVLEAMGRVRRECFVPLDLRDAAYEDRPLPIGSGQTISQPYIVAKMTALLKLKPDHRVLEIGTGCGYQTAILAEIAASVYSIEVVPNLARMAEAVLDELGYENVKVKQGDGYAGWPEAAPFDAIIVTCAPPHVPIPLIEQLADGGRLVVPVGASGSIQELRVLQRQGDRIDEKNVIPVVFVPMTGTAQDDDSS